MTEIDYTAMSDHQLLEISYTDDAIGTADPEAVNELLRRQHQGKALRLYPNGRRGPEDEGVLPIAMTYEGDHIAIDIGHANRSFVIPGEHFGIWAHKLSSKMLAMVKTLRREGYSMTEVFEELGEAGTPDFKVQFESIPGDEEMQVATTLFPNDLHRWQLGFNEVYTWIEAAIDHMDAMGWDAEDVGIDPLHLSNMRIMLDYLELP